MKASEALKISTDLTPIQFREMLNKHIESSASFGNTHLYWYVPKVICKELSKLLIGDGYVVKNIDTTYKDIKILISWN